jgi:NADH:ubiquinone oxidoreductase subunit K
MTLMLFCIGWNGISDFSLLLPIFLSNDFLINAYNAFTLKICTNIFSRINTHTFAEEAYQYLDLQQR